MAKELAAVIGAADEGPARGLVRALTGLSHSAVQGLFDHGCVFRDGAPCHDPLTPLRAGERVELRYDAGRRYRPKPRPRTHAAFRLVHEDPHLIVVDKAAGVLTVPAQGETDTLLDAVRSQLGRGARHPPKLYVVHRLDRDTSGLLVIARSAKVARALEEQFAAHAPERMYRAIVAGRLTQDRGTFRSHLAADASLNQRSTRGPDEGKLAITHFEVTARIPGATAVCVRLETGRRNQIRVHFSEAGHPVLGDRRYSPDQARHPRWPAKRLALHAAVLGFTHPMLGQLLRFESPLPEEFSRFLGKNAEGVRTPKAKARPRRRRASR